MQTETTLTKKILVIIVLMLSATVNAEARDLGYVDFWTEILSCTDTFYELKDATIIVHEGDYEIVDSLQKSYGTVLPHLLIRDLRFTYEDEKELLSSKVSIKFYARNLVFQEKVNFWNFEGLHILNLIQWNLRKVSYSRSF